MANKPTIDGVETILLREFVTIGSPLTDREKIKNVAVDIFHYCTRPHTTVDAETAARQFGLEFGKDIAASQKSK